MWLTTLIIALILLLLSAAALLVGYLLTGKVKLKKGCGPKNCTPGKCGQCKKDK
jgi:hypothetical protein